MFRVQQNALEVLLVHPGGTFWKNKDEESWSIPKGETADGEDLLEAARREFEEETGTGPQGHFIPLTPAKLKSGKIVHAWAVQGDLDAAAIKSNTFELEWPPRSGKKVMFPEVDRAAFFDLQTARRKINPGQAAFVIELETKWARKG